MPELPEVECVRLTLAKHLVGRKIRRAQLIRRDVVHPSPAAEKRPAGGAASAHPNPAAARRNLLAGAELAAVHRLGKQLALVADDGRVLCVHLGMTGSLQWIAATDGNATRSSPPKKRNIHASDRPADPHIHMLWHFDDRSVLQFRDPRRFGGIWIFPSLNELYSLRWRRLGEDALTITPRRLHRNLSRTHRPLKSALLDQGMVAGLGNIYVDELLFAVRINPARPADTLTIEEVRAMVRRMRPLLHRAIDAGGSTVRTYVDGNGARGAFQQQHQVYGRASQPCGRCRRPLARSLIAGRTTVFCTSCQQ